MVLWCVRVVSRDLVCRLDYPGIGPEHAWLKDSKRAEYYAVTDSEALEAFQLVSKLEGIIPALETSHAFAYLEVRVVGTACIDNACLLTEAVPDAGRRHDGGDQLQWPGRQGRQHRGQISGPCLVNHVVIVSHTKLIDDYSESTHPRQLCGHRADRHAHRLTRLTR